MKEMIIGLNYPEHGGRYLGELDNYHYFLNEFPLNHNGNYLKEYHYEDYYWPGREEIDMMDKNYFTFQRNSPNTPFFTKTIRKTRG